MARYLIKGPAFVDGIYFYADAQHPQVISLPDKVEPSRTWEPVDEAAAAALKKLGVKKAPIGIEDIPKEKEEFKAKEMTMKEMIGKGIPE